MMDEKLIDVILDRLKVIEERQESHRIAAEIEADQIRKELNDINRKLWYFVGAWTVLGSIATLFLRRIVEFLSGAS